MASTRWELWQEEILEKEYNETNLNELAEKLGKSVNAVKIHANRKGLKTKRYMSDEQKEYIRKHYRMKNHQEIADKIGFSRTSVEEFCIKEGLTQRWSEDEVNYIIENYGNMSLKCLSKKLNRSYQSVKTMVSRQGILLRENSGRITESDMANILGVDKWFVHRLVSRKDIKSKKVGNCVFISDQVIFGWMKNNPEKWKAVNCDKVFFANQKWFEEKLAHEHEEKRKARWGET